MKRTRIASLTLMILVCLFGTIGWLTRTPKPTLRFIGFRDQQYNTQAVFRASNQSGRTFSFYASSRVGCPEPVGRIRVRKSGVWETLPPGDGCLTGLYALPPHTEVELLAMGPYEIKATPFQLGVEFFHGTPSEIRSRKENWITRLVDVIHFGKNWGERELTWSDTTTQ